LSVNVDNELDDAVMAAHNNDDDRDTNDSSEHRPVSTADEMNALTVLREWLACTQLTARRLNSLM